MRTTPERSRHLALNWRALVTLALVSACRDPVANPAAPSFAVAGPSACPTPADVTVSDETGLTAALASATFGEVIALNGFFPVSTDVIIATPHVTLTCATPGSGIFAPPGSSVVFLLQVHASAVSVDRLVLDGGNLSEGPYLAGADAGTSLFFADSARLTNSRVTCGSPNGECTLFVGTRFALVADNSFVSAGSSTGVHMQSGIDDSRVERNTIVATAPSGGALLGGIRVRDGNNVVVADNIVRGPWGNSIAPTNLTGSHFENNSAAGPTAYGIRFGAAFSSSNDFRGNQITSAGTAGIFVQSACSNTFLGNSIEGNGRNPSAIFTATTGANVLVLIGAKNLVVDNGGGFDCNGDGVGDPNIIAGPGRVVRGGALSSARSAEIAGSGRLH